MPSGTNWLNFAFVNLGFIIQIVLMFYWIMAAEIRKDWNKYRCNPMFMPLSNNMQEDFTYCVQNIQTNYMGFLLQPITFLISSLTTLGGDLGNSLNNARNMISNIRTFVTSITGNIFGVFQNIVLEFQKTTIAINDVVRKFVGILVTMMFIMDGSQKTMASMWAGPPGKMVRALGSCFHPDTKVRLQSGELVFMKDLDLGAILENGSRVDTVMRINNTRNEPFYKLCCNKDRTNGDSDVYVTGTHLVKHNEEFIQVADHPYAERQALSKNTSWFTCLITHDHKIPISGYTFWDWEDDIITGLPHI